MNIEEMNIKERNIECSQALESISEGVADYASMAPAPITVKQTRVSAQLLKDLMLKHIYDTSVISVKGLAERMSLTGSVVDELSHLLRDEALVELSSSLNGDGTLSFRLTERGRFSARDAHDRSGYLGPAPVALEHYKEISEHFSLANHSVTQEGLSALFENFVVEELLLDQLGAAFNSRKAIFIYGSAGTGKTYTIGKMMALFQDACLVPHALSIKDTIVSVFDPQIHVPKTLRNTGASLLYNRAHDARYVPCQRPIVITGGELTADLLEVQFDPQSKTSQAPLQLKANNGIFFIDDIGRQSISPAVIFNRWIVPMEEGRDFLSLANGQHFEVPFDVQLVFSSNLNPLDLADEAALRRIGFKIKFEHIKPGAYRKIWAQYMENKGIMFSEPLLDYVLNELHFKEGVGLLPCHPRDLIHMALTQATYKGEPGLVTKERLYWAWQNYFVRLEQSTNEVIIQ